MHLSGGNPVKTGNGPAAVILVFGTTKKPARLLCATDRYRSGRPPERKESQKTCLNRWKPKMSRGRGLVSARSPWIKGISPELFSQVRGFFFLRANTNGQREQAFQAFSFETQAESEMLTMKTQLTIKTLLFTTILALALTMPSVAGHHGKETPMKKGILLVAFGSSMPQAQVSFTNIEANVKKAFPDVPVHWAYTSSIIRKKLASQGKNLDSVEMALARMMDQGFTHVAVQSLHTIRGEEYDDLEMTVNAFSHMPGGFTRLVIGNPLLTSQTDMEKVCKAVIANIPAGRAKNEAVVLMGHGSPHPSNAFYAAMMFHLQRKDPNVFVGTVEGSPGIDDIAGMLKEKKIKKAWLVPFMSVAGDHARNDMAGAEDDSWKSILTKERIVCVPVLKGTAEYDNMVAIWVDHLKEAMEHFK